MKKILLSFITIIAFSIVANAQNLIVNYEFNDSTDISVNDYHLETFGSGINYEFTSPAESGLPSDSCVHFKDGKGLKSVSTFNNATWTGVSVSFWIKDSTNLTQGFVIQSGTGFGIKLSSAGFISCFFDGSSTRSLISNTDIDDNKWHHIVAQNNGNTTSIYIDGVLDTVQSETMFIQSNQVYFYLGSSSANTEKIDAYIDDFRIYDDTLTQLQIDELGEVTSGIEESKIKPISFYPNPATSEITLNTIEKIQFINIQDISGRTVKMFIPPSNEIDVSDLTKGIYFLQGQTKTGMFSTKFIKH